jgi:two-component system, sensor histidine kinase LadS
MPRPYSILVVDEEPALLEKYCSALSEAGHRVWPAADGYQAIRILVERYADLLIAEINMPGLNGLELGAQAKLMCPGINVIYITGGQRVIDGAVKPPPGAIIRKPIRPADLLQAIDKAMAARCWRLLPGAPSNAASSPQACPAP